MEIVGKHTAENSLNVILNALQDFSVDKEMIMAVTCDTTSVSFNTFNNVAITSQIPCLSHTIQLIVKHDV